MKATAKLVSFLALVGTILPPTMFLLGHLDLEQVKGAMLVSTLLWFASAPLWMDQR